MRGLKVAKLTFVGLLIASFSLAGCSLSGCAPGGQEPGPSEKLTIEWWGVDRDEEYFRVPISVFEGKYSNINIEYVKKDAATYEQELIDALAANQGPDIAMIKSDWMAQHKNKLAPMELTGSEADKIKEQYLEAVTDLMLQDNQLYGLPLNIETLGLYYNEDMLSENRIYNPPSTWTEFNQAVKKVTRKNGDFINKSGAALGTSNNIGAAEDVLLTMMLQNGTKVASADKKSAAFHNSVQSSSGEPIYTGRKALSYYVDFSNPKKDVYSWNSKIKTDWKAFAEGKTAMIFDYQGRSADIYNQNPELNFEIAKVPQIKNVKPEEQRVIARYWSHSVTKDADNKQWVWAFIQTLTDKMAEGSLKEEAQAERNAITGEGALVGQGLIAETVYKGAQPEKFDNIFETMINNVVIHNQKISTAVDSAANQVTEIYQGS